METTPNPAIMGIVVAAAALVVFAAIWFFVSGLLASLSGWTRLAETFAAGPRPNGAILRRVVIKVGPVGENGVTALIATRDGLYLESHPVFRFRRPAVHVPWSRIRYVKSHRVLWQRSVTFDLGEITAIRVRDRAVDVFREHGVVAPPGSTA